MAGWTPLSPRNKGQNRAQSSSWNSASSQHTMVATFCFPISRLMSVKEVKVLPPKIASHFRVRRAASDPAEGERSGNKNMFSVSYTLSSYLVWKASAITMNAMGWGICGGAEAQDFGSAPAGRLHCGSFPVLLKWGYCPPDIWELRRCAVIIFRSMRRSPTREEHGVVSAF